MWRKSVLYLHPLMFNSIIKRSLKKQKMTACINDTWRTKPFWDLSIYFSCRQIKTNYNEEFDPGSGWTLAAGLTHASRGVTGGACTLLTTGARVRNAYATYLLQGDSPEKFGIIPHTIINWHRLMKKTFCGRRWACVLLVSWWGNGSPRHR